MELLWSPRALRRLEEIRDCVARDKPDAAARLATRIVAVIEALRTQPHMGRQGATPEVRELVIGGTPYIVIYRVGKTQIKILTIWHGAQRRA